MKSIVKALCIYMIFICLVSCSSSEEIHTHDYSSWEISSQPTCTEGGVLVRICACGAQEETQVDALSHAYDDGKVIKQATCTERGQTDYSCRLCGEVKQTATDMTPHNTDGYTDIGDGMHAKVCADCEHIGSKEEHYYGENGLCLVCSNIKTQKDN